MDWNPFRGGSIENSQLKTEPLTIGFKRKLITHILKTGERAGLSGIKGF